MVLADAVGGDNVISMDEAKQRRELAEKVRQKKARNWRWLNGCLFFPIVPKYKLYLNTSGAIEQLQAEREAMDRDGKIIPITMRKKKRVAERL